MHRQLISFVICAYNQQHCVAEAIESAFNQTYHPLEIIVSDDCSTDNTVNVIESIVSEYRGIHNIYINRNSKNLGIAMHWDFISRKANGRLIIHCAGDDISLPNRVSEIVSVWESIEPRPYLLSSNCMEMTISGDNVAPIIKSESFSSVSIQFSPKNFDFDHFDIPVIGSALAVDKRLYEKLAPLNKPMWSEDSILRSRALLLGPIVFIPDILVRYRDGGLSKGELPNKAFYIKRYVDQALSRRNYLEQLFDDYHIICVPPPQFLILTRKKFESTKRRLRMVESNSIFISLFMLCMQLLKYENEGVAKIQYVNMFAVRWFPKAFFAARSLRRRL